MATDDIWGSRKAPGAGTPQNSPQTAPPASWPYERPDLSRDIGLLEARLKSIAGRSSAASERTVDAAIDNAVAELARDIRSGVAIAGADAKPRHDFRLPSRRSAPAPPPPDYDLPPAENVESQFEAIRRRISEFSGEEAPSTEAVLPLAGADYLDVVERMEGLARSVPDRERIERLADAVARLGNVMAGSGHLSALASIESRLNRLSDEVGALAARPAADVELHARLAEIRNLLAAGGADKSVARLESQFAAIAERIDGALARVPRADAIVALANRLDAVTGRLDQIGANQNRPPPAIEALTREIVMLRREVTDEGRRADPAALDAQFSALARRFDAMARGSGAGTSVGQLEAQIARLTEKIEQSLAHRLTGAPVRATTTTGPKPADNPIIEALRDDLVRQDAAQSRAPAAAATLNEAMESFVRRLASMEAEARQKTGSRGAPPPPRARGAEIESAEDRRPLEPGTGRPQARPGRDGRKAEFVAAARRAAQAAAAESAVNGRLEARPRANPLRWIGSTIHRHQRPLIAGAAAVTLAIGALQVFSLRQDKTDPTMTATTAPPAVAKVDNTPVLTTADPAAIDATAPEQAAPPSPAMVAAAPSTDFAAPDPFDNRFMAIDGADHFTPAAPTTPALPTIPDAVRSSLPPEARNAGPQAPPGSRMSAPTPPEPVGSQRLRTAAAAGDPDALFEVAARFAEGRGVKADAAEAAKWYGLAAERGLAVAQFRYASINERGEGVAQNRKAAVEWYRRAAEQGNVRAMHNLGVMLSEGVGGSPDFAEAARWFAKAADYGVKDSQYNLGVMFARGLGGEQDLVQSYKWFAIAAQQGDADATSRRDEVAKTLSPDQLAQAQAAVLSWRANDPPEKANTPPSADDWGPSGPVSALDRTGLVKLIQERLADRGFDPGPADGQPGPMTREAVIAFQRQSGVPATGEIGPELLAALDFPAH